jgi:hypothetical protein
MGKMLVIMNYIALCTPWIALVNGGHLLHMRVDHAEPESEFQADQVQWAFGGPKASSYEDANIIESRQAPVHPTKVLVFCI